jgi:hypothetical protein
MRYVGVVAVLSLVLFTSGTASAISVIGDPIEGESWSHTFEESGVGQFNFMQARMTSATGDFEPPAFQNPTTAGWNNLLSTDPANILIAQGPAVTWLQFDFAFTETSATPLTFIFSAFYNDTLLESREATWDGSGWVITGDTGEPAEQRQEPIPEPVTMAGLMMGIGGLVGYIRKRRAA